MNKNMTENIEENEAQEEVTTECAAEENIEEISAETQTDGESACVAEKTKKNPKMFLIYICALVVFMAVAVVALVCFGIYTNNLVHGGSDSNFVNSIVEINQLNA